MRDECDNNIIKKKKFEKIKLAIINNLKKPLVKVIVFVILCIIVFISSYFYTIQRIKNEESYNKISNYNKKSYYLEQRFIKSSSKNLNN
jgi:hypothetical protein